ncbi:hypothetical protein N9C85_01045 [Synechococcus sp. AH-224-I15]|nr:hypothetical protein [Synechococcus sp. AH-224-I15]
MSDFHFDALVRFEAQQTAGSISPTFWVKTSDWEKHCSNHEELGEMTAAAVMEGLAFQVELCPF